MTGNSGPLGGSTNRPRSDPGTLILRKSHPPGAMGKVSARKPVTTLRPVVKPGPPPAVAPVASKTAFHPGLDHGHLPSGRWADVQADPNSSFELNRLCPWVSPMELVEAALVAKFLDKPIATAHLAWYLAGAGADFIEDANIAEMLRKDTGVQAAIARRIPPGPPGGKFTGFFKLEQSDYADQDFRFAFGAIDRLDFEVDVAAGTIHVWFQDRYEWHPYYPKLYRAYPDDAPRDTNCLHAALVELKASGAADFWMKGEATVPLSLVRPGKGGGSGPL